MRLAVDFADPSRAERVPRHGWAKNSQGIKLLWAPILRLTHDAQDIRKSNGLEEELSRGQWSEIRAFDQTTVHFALVLREVAKCVRLGSDPCSAESDREKATISYEASTLLPLYIDLAFVYVRRLADHFARASRYALFKNFNSAPREYKNLILHIADKKKLERLKPLCDITLLREAFEQHSGWLNKLRDSTNEDGELVKGIRDIMEHHPATVTVQHSKLGDGPWEVNANLGDPGINASFRADLIPTLKEIVADIAALWTGVCTSAGLPVAKQLWVAPYGDRLPILLTGNEDDWAEFWPESTP